MPHKRPTTQRTAATGKMTAIITTYASEFEGKVGVGVDVAMGIMVSIALMKSMRVGLLPGKKQKHTVKPQFHPFIRVDHYRARVTEKFVESGVPTVHS